jgi:hypothetical protein
MSAITIDSTELKALIRSVVDEAVEERLAKLESDWDDEATDQALARAMDEARTSPIMTPAEFRQFLESDLNSEA